MRVVFLFLLSFISLKINTKEIISDGGDNYTNST